MSIIVNKIYHTPYTVNIPIAPSQVILNLANSENYPKKLSQLYRSGFWQKAKQSCPKKGKDLKFMVIILSKPQHFKIRAIIRKTWGRTLQQKWNASYAFIVGDSESVFYKSLVLKEMQNNSDMIHINNTDTYWNLPLKVTSMLEWMIKYCPKAPWLFKVDDDVYLNANAATRLLERLDNHRRGIYGEMQYHSIPSRNLACKYYVPMTMYSEQYYPMFVTGPGYLLPSSVIKELYSAALYSDYFKLEDVFFTGILASRLRITRYFLYKFWYFGDWQQFIVKPQQNAITMIKTYMNLTGEKSFNEFSTGIRKRFLAFDGMLANRLSPVGKLIKFCLELYEKFFKDNKKISTHST